MGDKPWQITADAIAEAEAAKALGDDEDIGEAGAEGDDSSEWEYDNPTESLEANKAGEDGDAPPTPILDAYERSRDPVEMERLIAMSFDSLPERAGPQRYNHKRREQQRYKTIRVSQEDYHNSGIVLCLLTSGVRVDPSTSVAWWTRVLCVFCGCLSFGCGVVLYAFWWRSNPRRYR